jgi:hypothetical protein
MAETLTGKEFQPKDFMTAKKRTGSPGHGL